jgi:hypothetical protein
LGTFREHSGNIQGTFREHSGNIQGTFREHSGNVAFIAFRTRGSRKAMPGSTQGTFGNIQGIFREHSGNIQGTSCRKHSASIQCRFELAHLLSLEKEKMTQG